MGKSISEKREALMKVSAEARNHLAADDLRVLLDLVARMQKTERVDQLFPAVHAGLKAWIPCDALSLSASRFRTGMVAVAVHSCGNPPFSKEQYEYYSKHALDHPVAARYVQDGRCDAIRVSDLIPTDEWITTEFYEQCLAWRNYRYSLISAWPVSRNTIFLFNFDRSKADFTDTEKIQLNAFTAHFGMHYDLVREIERRKPPLLRRRAAGHPSGEDGAADLTKRENEVLAWVAEGKSNEEIAVILKISPRTVQKHLENCMRKLGVENRISAAMAVVAPGGRGI